MIRSNSGSILSRSIKAIVLGLGILTCSSCSATPETVDLPGEAADDGHAVASTNASPETKSQTAAAPMGETRASVAEQTGSDANYAVHRRPEPPKNLRVNRWLEMKPLYDLATVAANRCEFAVAEDLYRRLRDDPATPNSMRARFHGQVSHFAGLHFRMNEVRKALVAQSFTAASRRLTRLQARHPNLPLVMIIGSEVAARTSVRIFNF